MNFDNYYYYCQRCKRIVDPTWYVGHRTYSTRNLTAPYFMCNGCRTIGAYPPHVKNTIAEWRRSLYSRKRVPSCRNMYTIVMRDLDLIMSGICAQSGYRRVRCRIPQRPPEHETRS